MKTSKRGIDLIKKYEGFRNTAYLCPAGVWTIGWGSTIIKKMKVKKSDQITLEEAEAALMDDIEKFEAIVNSIIKINLTQNKFDALVSHTYNTGGSDTLFNLINSNASEGVIRNWWEETYITSNGNLFVGLVNRRCEEANLFFEKH